MDSNPIKTAARRQRRTSQLPAGPRICVLCDELDLITLVPVTVGWLTKHEVAHTLFEDHHAVGRAHDPDLVVPICRNCHAKATEGLLRSGVSMRPAPDTTSRVAMMLDALAAFFEQLVAALRRWAAQLRSGMTREASHG